jgi:hypothetical protein
MRNAVLAVALVLVLFGDARAQTSTQLLEHLDDLGQANEKLQQRVRTLETENKELRERLRQLGAAQPSPPPAGAAAAAPTPPPAGAAAAPPTQPPIAAAPKPVEAPQPARASESSPPRVLPGPLQTAPLSPVAVNGTIDFDSEPQGALVATSLGANCETPCAMELSASAPFTVTFTRPGYASATVDIHMQPAQPGLSNPKFSPNPVFVQLAREATKKRSTLPPPQKLGPER